MPAIPKPASTVVLMDDMSRIYLTKRPHTMKFLGGYYVFPGGAVDIEDAQMDPRFINPPKGEQTFSTDYYVAAARELFEEVGIFLGRSIEGAQSFFKEKTAFDYRRLLVEREISFQNILQTEGLKLQLDSLQYFGHFITPEFSPIRYDTRFFLAKLPKDQEPQPDAGEIADAYWVDPEEAIVAFKEKKIPLAPPTIASLHAIVQHLHGQPLKMPDIQDFIR
ncbi:NUDIX hydrolase [Robertmurraya andreesenii]|uniref:8-oxo-dGTP pyrophosphatase MutT (NUDIX family) n=1 Tax=Anoxybacillus andreesenii TaxID=1325932 RepID=A0ABT9V0X2_9BACL|nr:NUDIX hydrolase [Robertmurraya andreesenii]MDQ0154561.1 8-oxo-dGTP pyrophosphatase MutT (NUDIX family) [Robertmurraya andreesenii]